jgi:hypothetical protein
MGGEERGIVGPVDIEALARHVIRLSGELERAWSDALDNAVMARSEKELNGEIGALATAMIGAVQNADAKLNAADIDTTIGRWPYDPALFKSLERSSSSQDRRGQLVIAQMIVLRQVLEAFKALNEPSGEEIDLLTQSRTTWFESGAFLLIKKRAELLLRITQEVDNAGDVLLAQPSVPKLDRSIEAAFDLLGAARGAYSSGDIDASVLHCRGALRAILESLPFLTVGDERLLNPGTLLAQAPSLDGYGSPLRLLDTEANALGSRRVEPGIGVPLVEGLLPVIATILHEPPIAELQGIIASEEIEL